jgi:hypothetical protein
MSHTVAAVSRVYSWLLKLYPRSFRADFADEMRVVFAQAFQDTARQGKRAVLAMCFWEFVDLPVNLLLEHWHRKEKAMKLFHYSETQEIQIVRWIARISSILLTVLFGIVILITDQPAHFVAVILAMTIALLLAWRWERIGGLLIIAIALSYSIGTGLYSLFSLSIPNLGLLQAILWGLVCILIALVVLVLPYLVLGWLFVSVARRSGPATRQSDRNSLSGLGLV